MKVGRIGVLIVSALIVVAVLWLANSSDTDDTVNVDGNLSPQDLTAQANRSESDAASQLLDSGKTAVSNGEFEPAINAYTTALELDTDASTVAELYYQRAVAYLAMGQADLALSDADSAIELINDNSDYYLIRAQALTELGRFEAAIVAYSTAIDMDRLAVDALLGRGDLYYRLGDDEHALLDADAALDIDPDNAAALVARSAVYLAQDNRASAIQDLELALQFSADYAPAYFYRAVANYHGGEQFESLQDLNRAIDLDSQNAAAHYVRGLVYAKEGDNDLAISDFSRAIQLDPTYAAAYRSRALAYARQGQVNSSQSDRRQAMWVDPTIAGISVGDYDLEITRIWATDRANGRRPVERDQFLVIEMKVYNYGTDEVCLNRDDFPRLREGVLIAATGMENVQKEFYPNLEFPTSRNGDPFCISPLAVRPTFLSFDTYRTIRDFTIEFSPTTAPAALTLMLLRGDSDYFFAISALDGQPIPVVGDVVITNEVRTEVLETRTAVLDNCLGTSDRSRTDTIEHEEAFSVEVQTTTRSTSGNGAQFESIEANSIRIRPPIPYIGDLLPITIDDLKINLVGQMGTTSVEETTTTESTSRLIRSSIAVTTTAAPGTRESTAVTWYMVNKQGYVETTINGTAYQVPFSITDTLEADSVSVSAESCG